MAKIKVVIELEIEGDEEDVDRVVEGLLDAGIIQDCINEHDIDDAGQLEVTSASHKFV